jgi:hypothetical protein
MVPGNFGLLDVTLAISYPLHPWNIYLSKMPCNLRLWIKIYAFTLVYTRNMYKLSTMYRSIMDKVIQNLDHSIEFIKQRRLAHPKNISSKHYIEDCHKDRMLIRGVISQKHDAMIFMSVEQICLNKLNDSKFRENDDLLRLIVDYAKNKLV